MSIPFDSPVRDKPPCKGCTERHEACWGKCEKYKAWKSNLENVNAERKKYSNKPFVRYNPFDY